MGSERKIGTKVILSFGVIIGVTAVVGLGCLVYRKIKKHLSLQPRILCCQCVTDEEIDELLMQSEYEDWSEYEDE